MKTSIERIWDVAFDKARVSPPQPGEYLIFLLDEHSENKVYGGVDGEGSCLLAIEVHRKPPAVAVRSGALDYFRHQRKGFATWLMALRLQSGELSPVFGRLCQDLIDEIAGTHDEDALVKLVHRRLALWQRLFDSGNSGLLAEYQVKGLVAELLFMESVLSEQKYGLSEVAIAWVGPSGADQDFQFSGEAVEVKAVGPGARDVTISSLKQLDGPLPISLNLWTLRPASPGEATAITLNGIIAKLEQCFAPNPGALAAFRDALLEAGYVEHPHYDQTAFEPLKVESFPVGDEFPRLTTAMVPTGVESAVYAISLQDVRKRN
ncbi:PD-(D/E)XK motif protein [Luteimonas sp. MC1825]|uniref:PD-(D/E)XK motif protein n=1 Tax=Luteimonas sp. MC1825 TaxID=2761107 RepID=UPI00160CDC1C|nr:PD-(D/E)XK motif protein [Luteimonas sp. MC1825]MBB6599609.1 PD-(D/E)XK motif protein [Luteimonas sp. MC1825]QOC87301.1 PD-(D/E)XK motif protein [Luteimonas sp. MC1825]